MKRNIRRLAACAAVVIALGAALPTGAATLCGASATIPGDDFLSDGRTLSWSDEFNGTSLDTNRWTRINKGGTVQVPLKDGWRFVKADDPAAGTNLTLGAMSDILDRASRGDASSAPVFGWAQPAFDDSTWCKVRVPHDWGVEKPFDPDRAYGDAFLDVTGIGWYRLKFRVVSGELRVGGRSVPIPANGKVFFECDGAMSYAMLYLNGRVLGGWPYGYTRWRVDLTDCLGDGEHTIAIRCHNVKDSSRWYTGSCL